MYSGVCCLNMHALLQLMWLHYLLYYLHYQLAAIVIELDVCMVIAVFTLDTASFEYV